MSKKIVFGVVAVLMFAVIGGLLTTHLVGSALSAKIGSVDVPDSTLASAQPLPQNFLSALSTPSDGKPVNILVIGSDTRSGENSKYGETSTFDTARSDTTMLVHLSGDRTRATVMSVPRDLWIKIPSCALADGSVSPASENRFNSAYSTAGAACTVKTFTTLTNIPVNHVIEVDFTGFKKIVDTVGGIDVCVREPINDPDAQLNLPVGQYTVDGEQALGLARARYTLGDGSDISRIQRQQILLRSMISKIKNSATLTDPARMYQVLSDTMDSISADKNLRSLPALATLAWQARDISQNNIEFITIPTTDRGDGATVSMNAAEAKKMFNTIIQDRNLSATPSPASSADSNSELPATGENPEFTVNSDGTEPACTIPPIN